MRKEGRKRKRENNGRKRKQDRTRKKERRRNMYIINITELNVGLQWET
jgi:hypothetical protein